MYEESDSDNISSVSSILPQIDTIVYVMFENRSLDNLLGWLYEDDSPQNIYPPGSEPSSYDGLIEGAYTLPLKHGIWGDVTNYPVQKGVGEDGMTVPNLDPYEEYEDVLNQIFGDAENTVNYPPSNGTIAGMQGFLQDFDADAETWDETLQITETYTGADLPIINSLAKQYAVSDRWYSSMPTNTNPNRAFSLCGTSLGRLKDSLLSIEQFKTNTIWNALAAQNVPMGIYYHEHWFGAKCYTEYTFPNLNQVNTSGSTLLDIVQIDDSSDGFYARAQAGTLPAFSYIEPKWGFPLIHTWHEQGNDYHPPTDVCPGEQLLHDIYTALTSNPQAWERTLLIVTFDEHGGTYDHHPPAWGATNPNDPDSRNSPFNFELFGVRVPALLISPYIPPGTVFRTPTDMPFDHTSILATLLRWKGIDPANAGLYDRVAAAPTFEGVLSSDIVNKGIDLPSPNCAAVSKSAPNRILEGLPVAIRKHIGQKAKNLSHMKLLADDYRNSQENY